MQGCFFVYCVVPQLDAVTVRDCKVRALDYVFHVKYLQLKCPTKASVVACEGIFMFYEDGVENAIKVTHGASQWLSGIIKSRLLRQGL